MFDRKKIIDSLISNDVGEIENVEWIVSVLRSGFKGYDHMTDEELISECEDRDISYLFGEDDDA